MTDKKVKVGLLGAGGLAQIYHIPNLRALSTTEIVSVYDSDTSRSSSIANRFGIPNWFDDPELMLKDSDLDCVLITTPTITHLPLSQIAFENGVDVFIEKPFARNSEEGRRIIKSAADNGRIVMVGMNHRFREDVSRLKKLLDEEQIGEIYSIKAGWLKRLGVWGRPYWFTDPKLAGGGVLMDFGLQMIDLIIYLLNFPTVVQTNCSVSSEVLGLEVEDSAAAFLRFDNDSTLLLDVSWANCEQKDVAYTHFSGSYGQASLAPLNIIKRHGDKLVVDPVGRVEDENVIYRNSFQTEIAHFIECVISKTETLSSGYQAVGILEIIEKLYQDAIQ